MTGDNKGAEASQGRPTAITFESPVRPRRDPFQSPAKGILLTPGTGATRRKTVSFGGFLSEEQMERPSTADANPMRLSDLAREAQSTEDSPSKKKIERTRSLSRTLFKSKKSPPKGSKKPLKSRSPSSNTLYSDTQDDALIRQRPTSAPIESLTDVTMDLNQPRSRSGNFWKSEFEQYHKRSDREMKQVIQHGQKVKSYAAKKDAEANNLQEKLGSELSKGAAMEHRVTELATELARLRSKESELGSDAEEELVNDLAKHALSAAKSKNKAERYKAALDEGHTSLAKAKQHEKRTRAKRSQDTFDGSGLAYDMRALEETASAASKRAITLDAENKILKDHLEQMKRELSENETRRKARETKLREATNEAVAAKQRCEAELAQLRRDYQILQATSTSSGNTDPTSLQRKMRKSHSPQRQPVDPLLHEILEQAQHWDKDNRRESSNRKHNRNPRHRSSRSPQRSPEPTIEYPKPPAHHRSPSPTKDTQTPSHRTQPFVEPFSAFPKTFRRPKSQLMPQQARSSTSNPQSSITTAHHQQQQPQSQITGAPIAGATAAPAPVGSSSGFDIWDLTASPETSRPNSQQQPIAQMTSGNPPKPLRELSRNLSGVSPPEQKQQKQQPGITTFHDENKKKDHSFRRERNISFTTQRRSHHPPPSEVAKPVVHSPSGDVPSPLSSLLASNAQPPSSTPSSSARRVSSMRASVGVGERKASAGKTAGGLPPDRAKAARERLRKREAERKVVSSLVVVGDEVH